MTRFRKRGEMSFFSFLMNGSNKLILGNLHLRKKECAKLLKVNQLFLLQVASFIFSFENNLLPPFSDNYLVPVVRH